MPLTAHPEVKVINTHSGKCHVVKGPVTALEAVHGLYLEHHDKEIHGHPWERTVLTAYLVKCGPFVAFLRQG